MDLNRLAQRLESDPAFRKRAEKRAVREVIEGFLQTAVAHGHISVEDKSPEKIIETFLKHLSLGGLESSRLLFAIDHTDELRALGRDCFRKGNQWVACVLYATWVEHTLNLIISTGVYRRGFGDAEVKQVIRDVPFPGKLSWLLPLLGFRPIHPTHRKTLKALAEKRNEFVHYKWPYEENRSDSELKSLLVRAEKALRYLAQYKTVETLKRSKSRIAKFARGVAPRSHLQEPTGQRIMRSDTIEEK